MYTKCEQCFVTCRKRYYNQSGRVYISILEHCRKMKFGTFLHLTLISNFFMLSQLSDFVVCGTHLYIKSNESINKV